MALPTTHSRGKRKQKFKLALWVKLVATVAAIYTFIALYFLIFFEMEQSQDNTVFGRALNVLVQPRTQPLLDREAAEKMLQRYGPDAIRKVVTAYLEPPMNDIIPGTINQGWPDDPRDPGTPPKFVSPLPLRTHTPQDLREVHYPQLQTCHDIPAKLPVDRGLQLDADGNVVYWNTHKDYVPGWDDPQEEIPYCPVSADPFLPWIHDLFASPDGQKIHIVAQNKRRCKTGRNFRDLVQHMTPQVALFQHVSVQRISEDTAQELAPELWSSETEATDTRYRLAPLEESDPDGTETRFICRFHTTDLSSEESLGTTTVVGETLSTYPFNYEFAHHRELLLTMLNPKGADNGNLLTSTLLFDCPVPPPLQNAVATGETILSDGTATLHVDIIPIRTSPRYGNDEVYLTTDMAGPKERWHETNPFFNASLWRDKDTPLHGFDAPHRWGDKQVLPRVEASGRWENLPICRPPAATRKEIPALFSNKKPYTLTACVWASASYKNRGVGTVPVTDPLQRMAEWLEFHLMVGFDHIYVYDNSGANAPNSTLQSVTDMFPPEQVTRIEWPHTVCNNGRALPSDNPGERSSQYAAENSCRVRYGPLTDWMATFDVDEYIIPMGNYESLKDVVRHVHATNGTNNISFRSTRAYMRHDASRDMEIGREKLPERTFLETYNCDSALPPKPLTGERAKKEIFAPSEVLLHYVHYTLVTPRMMKTYSEDPAHWHRESEYVPDYFPNELTEAILLHTKTSRPHQTKRWERWCHVDNFKSSACLMGFPYPPESIQQQLQGNNASLGMHDENSGYVYNCYPVDRVTNFWLPRLLQAMAKRKQGQASSSVD